MTDEFDQDSGLDEQGRPGDKFDPSKPAANPLSTPTGPLEVRPGCNLVGHRNPASMLQCNTYVRSFEGSGSPVHVCVDPGSQVDYSVVEANINHLIGDVGELHSFSLNHQDPDVIGNARYLCDANPNISAIVTEEVWRLAQHTLIRPGRIHFANSGRSKSTMIGDQHHWQLVPTPFCHFRGAMAFYDPELRTLFSGDLFGGLNLLGRVQLLAEEQDWAGVAQFHQIYMPTRDALRYAVRQIRALQPAVEVIAPQHGHVIAGDLVELFMERMYDLLVGHDLLSQELDESFLDGYREASSQVIAMAADSLGHDEVIRRLQDEMVGDGLEQLIKIEGHDVRIERDGFNAVVKLLSRLSADAPALADVLRAEVLSICTEQGLPIPPIGVGIQEQTDTGAIGPDGIATQTWWLK